MIELAHVCKRLKINPIKTFAHIFELVEIDEATYSICMQAAVYIEKYNLAVFDAFNAAFCGNNKIISSDSVYDKIGIGRIKLEEETQA